MSELTLKPEFRDIKPENILLDADGHVHLADFNIAYEMTTQRITGRCGSQLYTGAHFKNLINFLIPILIHRHWIF